HDQPSMIGTSERRPAPAAPEISNDEEGARDGHAQRNQWGRVNAIPIGQLDENGFRRKQHAADNGKREADKKRSACGRGHAARLYGCDRAPHARQAQPAMKATPPIGVIHPIARVPTSASTYRLPLNNTMPATNRPPAARVARVGQRQAAQPTASSASA